MSVAPGGWLPYDERNFAQQMMSDSWRHATPRFGEVGGDVDLPEQALLYDLEVKANGKLCSRIWQQEGSCVGAAGARSYTQSMCGDKVHRHTGEEIKDLCPWPTWGIGRKIGGLNSRGAGSFGAAQAKAVETWGMLPADDARLPQPTNRDGWLVWSSKIELDFSAPRYWPVPESELAPTAGNHQSAHQSENCAAGAHRHSLRVGQCVGNDGTTNGRYEVQHDEPEMAEDAFQGWTEREEHVHVERDVQE